MLIDEDDEGETEDCGMGLEGVETDEPILQQLELSAVSAFGFDGPRTMKLKGVIAGQPVVVMIDSGATHCFIAKEVVEKLKIGVDEDSVLPVLLGDGKNTHFWVLLKNYTKSRRG